MSGNLNEEEVKEALEEADEREVYNDVMSRVVSQASAQDELTQAEEETHRLLEENERLREEIERVRGLPMKERIYDHVHVSVRTIDIFIGGMLVIAVLAVIAGMS